MGNTFSAADCTPPPSKLLMESQQGKNLPQEKIEAFKTFYAHIPCSIICYSADESLRLLYFNRAFLHLIKYDEQEISKYFSSQFLPLILPKDRHLFLSQMAQPPDDAAPVRSTYRLQSKTGEILWILEERQAIKTQDGLSYFCCALIDITTERKTYKALKRSEERYKIIVEQSRDIMFEWDFTTDTVLFSDKCEKFFGFSPLQNEFSHNTEILKKIHPEDQNEFKAWMQNTYKKADAPSFEFRIQSINETYFWMKSRSTAIVDSTGNPAKAIGAFSNIDNQKSTVDYFKLKSQQDSLTKLLNKGESHRYIEKYLATSSTYKKAAMILVDIDNFKGVNDNLGHQFGDTVLLDISRKIKKLFRATDIVGRFGGDEFVIFMREITDETIVHEKTGALINAMRSVYFGEKKKYNVSGSAGIAFYPEHGTTFKDLYRCADIALYESKNKGKDCYTVYHDNLADEDPGAATPLESPERFITGYFEGDPIYNIFEMLYETKDIKITINMILEIIGKQFNVDRVYIFEHSDDGKFSSNTYEWCAEGIAHEMGKLQNISTKSLKDFLSFYNKEGIFHCNDLKKLDSFSYEALSNQGIKSLLHCAIFDSGKIRGFIGFDDCTTNRIWRGEEIATLGYISRILSTFILKKQISKELWNSYQNYTEMLDNLNGYIYVIDRKTHKTLYLNKAIKVLGAKVGEKCHKIAFFRDTPCENCPVRLLDEGTSSACEKFYSVRINTWVNAAASKLKWTGGKDAALICCISTTPDTTV